MTKTNRIRASFILGAAILTAEDYVKIGEEICVPMVQKEMLKRLDEMLVQMGYEKLHLSEKL